MVDSSVFNEKGYDFSDVDLFDLLDWVQTGPGRWLVLDNGQRTS